jgi:hypothetical protein
LALRCNPVADDLLSERELREHIDFEVVAHDVERDLRYRTAFADSRIVDENVEVPAAGAGHVIGIEQVELLDAKRRERERL